MFGRYQRIMYFFRKLSKGVFTVSKNGKFLTQKANSGFIGAQKRIISLLTSNAKERYAQLSKQYPGLLQRIPKTQLALYLGVSRETLSRLYS